MAKSRSIGGIYASLSLRDGSFSKGLKSARASLNKFGSMALKSGAVAAGAMAAGLVVGTKGALSMVDAVGDLSAATGVGIADMMKLQRSYADGGRDAGKAAKDIGKMQQSIFNAATGGIDPFADLKLSAAELMKLSPMEQFEAIGDAISRIENPTVRTAKAMEIFGRSGAGLATVFGTLEDSERVLGKMPALAEKFGGAIDQANDALGRLPVKSDQFFVGFTAGIIGELLPALGKIDEHDFTTVGQNLGTTLAAGVRGLTDGSLWGIAADMGISSFLRLSEALGNSLLATIKTAFDYLDHLSASLGSTEFGNSLAAHINTVIDGISHKSEDGKFDYDERVEHYKKGKAEAPGEFDFMGELAKNSEDGPKYLSEIADGFDKRASDAFDLLKGEVGDGLKAASSIGTPSPIENPITGVADMESVKAASAPKALDVNEYQRRGLSLGVSMSTPNKDELKTLQSIDKTLREAKKTGTLNWD